MKTSTAAPPSRNSTPLLWAVLLALIITGSFRYISGAYPGTSLLIDAILGVICCVLLLGFVSQRGSGGGMFQLGFAPLAGILLACYAAARWLIMPISYAGRPIVIDFLWFAVALGVGLVLPQYLRSKGEEPAEAAFLLRRLMTLVLLGFTAYAFYQHFIGYPAQYAAFAAEHPGPPDDLRTEAMLHALEERRVAGGVGNANLFAAQISFMSLLALSCVSRRDPWLWSLLGIVAWLSGGAAVWLTASRGGLLTYSAASVLAAVVHLILGSWSMPNRKSAGLLIIGCVSLLLLSDHVSAANWAERLTRSDTIRERFYYWQIACRLFLEHPLWGAGPGGFVLNYPLLKPDLARETQYAHSWLLQAAADLGLAGILLSCGFWGALLVKTLRLLRGLRCCAEERAAHAFKVEAIWFLLAALVLGFNGLFEFSLQWREYLISAGLFAGFGCALVQARKSIPAGSAFQRRSYIWIALLTGISVAAVWLSIPFQRALAAEWDGQDAQDAGDLPSALVYYENAARLQPDTPRYLLAQAGVLQAQGGSRGFSLLEQAQRLDPRSPGVRAAQARWYVAQRDYARALQAIDQAIALYPSNAGHHFTRAELLLQIGDTAAARAELEAVDGRKLPLLGETEERRRDHLRALAGLPPISK